MTWADICSISVKTNAKSGALTMKISKLPLFLCYGQWGNRWWAFGSIKVSWNLDRIRSCDVMNHWAMVWILKDGFLVGSRLKKLEKSYKRNHNAVGPKTGIENPLQARGNEGVLGGPLSPPRMAGLESPWSGTSLPYTLWLTSTWGLLIPCERKGGIFY